ncbi:hypothetical protein SAMD00023353_1801750 [Rosellinia necatrix]|uniref:Uncharacterized protein n=1 Tax=Rosellinia necatrix TaxID=77044 RepID=A0A1W2TDZ8_ROSNE|nr:hypothetical protein SAMD00023353_1801750 [Rosellinia necatrix]
MPAHPSLTPFGLLDFPRGVQPPISSNSVAGFGAEAVRADALGTRIVVHGRFPRLAQQFLAHKRRHGSAVERAFYHAGWTWERLAARLVERRALAFVGAADHTVLRTGEVLGGGGGGGGGGARAEWDRVGTGDEPRNARLTLRDYLSYDEIMLGSLLGVSGPSHFINDGRRHNCGHVAAPGDFEPRGVIVGLVGPRFERQDRMDSMYILSDSRAPLQHPHLREIFLDFFGRSASPEAPFDRSLYKARIRITADILFLEANRRAVAAGKRAYVYVVGLGLGVWAWHGPVNQALLYVQACLESLEELADSLSHIDTVEFGWIDKVLGFEQRWMSFGASRRVVDVRFSKRNPAEKLRGDDEGKLLVLSYAWDGNAFPGNEYWSGSLDASGDPAAACMSTIGELHNPLINPAFLDRIKVLEKTPTAPTA